MPPLIVRHPRCVLQWAPFTKLDWNKNFDGKLIVSSFFAHHGLVCKSRLMQILKDQARDDNVLASCLCDSVSIESKSRTLDADNIRDMNKGSCWVLKQSNANNATQVYFVPFDDAPTFIQALGAIIDTCNTASWLLQQCVTNPLLFRKRKFHIRCNVLAVGRLTVFAHRHCAIHVACEEYQDAQWDNKFIHITNHVIQSTHPKYNPSSNHVSLEDLETELGQDYKGIADKIIANIKSVVADTFAAMQRNNHNKDFFPTLDAFELYGFDFMVQNNPAFTVKLLEVNSGPALEGHKTMNTTFCNSVVSDTVTILLNKWLSAKYDTEEKFLNAYLDLPAEGGFEKVFAHVDQTGGFLSPAFRKHIFPMLKSV